jgi:hypothetical protein
MSSNVQASALKRTGPPPSAPAWLRPLWTPKLVSIWRCGSCLRIYRGRRSPISACESCPRGQVVQWKRCSKCGRWRDASGYYLLHRRWLMSCCRRCYTIQRVRSWSARYWSDPEWAAKVRQARRDRHARSKQVAA